MMHTVLITRSDHSRSDFMAPRAADNVTFLGGDVWFRSTPRRASFTDSLPEPLAFHLQIKRQLCNINQLHNPPSSLAGGEDTCQTMPR